MTGSVDDPVVLVDMTVTCTQRGCENEGIEIVAQVSQDAPHVVCGPCGTVLVGEEVL